MAPSKLRKCDICVKSITTKSPGVECSKCGMLVHANAQCAGLTAKQLAAIKASGKLEWMCDECHTRSPRRTSLIIPDEDEQEDDDAVEMTPILPKKLTVDVQKMTQNITREIEKAIKKQLGEIEKALEFCSNKVDEFEKDMNAFRVKTKQLEKKNESLENTNKHLELKIMAMEQKINESEQKTLTNCLEIVGIPQEENQDSFLFAKDIAKKLELNPDELKSAKRIKAKNDGTVLVELKDNTNPAAWVKASRLARIKVSDIKPSCSSDVAGLNIILRHALTTHNKTLLYHAKQQLKETHKYIWVSAEGKLLVRKNDTSKIKTIRFEEDIKKLSLS